MSLLPSAAAFEAECARLFLGAPSPLLERMALPLPVMLGEDVVVLKSRPALARAFAAKAQALRAAGVTGLAPRIVAAELPRGGRFCLWLDLQRSTPAGTQPGDRLRVFCSAAPGLPRIEMIECLHSPEPHGRLAADLRMIAA